MDSFPFTFNLIFNDEKKNIQPTLNFLKLKEKITELFSISDSYLYYKEKEIKNETDYYDLINEITDSEFVEVDINIYSEPQEKTINDDENKNEEQQNNNNKILEIGIENKYDSYGDTRNRKGNQEDKYTNQNKGFYEQKRIYYIKEKKEMQREEQEMENNNKINEEEEKEEEEQNKKKGKKKRKK